MQDTVISKKGAIAPIQDSGEMTARQNRDINKAASQQSLVDRSRPLLLGLFSGSGGLPLSFDFCFTCPS